jgi:hypothetical protein
LSPKEKNYLLISLKGSVPFNERPQGNKLIEAVDAE